MSSTVTISDYWRVARYNRNFRRLWLAQIVSEIGDWFYTIAIYSLLLQFTGKASSVALALMLQVLPLTFFGPLAGVINDRISRRRVMIAADLIRAVIVSSMLLVRSASLVWLIYVLLFFETVMVAFFEPARNSVIPNVTPPEDVVVANTMSSTTWSFNLAVGATLGGIIAALLGRDAVFLFNAASFLISASLIARMNFAEPHLDPAKPLKARDLLGYGEIVDGARYIGRDRRLLSMVLVKGGIGIVGASWVIIPVMGRKVFPLLGHGMDLERAAIFSMSLMLGIRGVGALIGPLVLARWAGRRQERLRLGILFGFVIGGIGYSLLGMSPNLALACASIAFAHFGLANVWVFSNTLLQLNSDDRFRGRVFAADLGFAMGMIALFAWLAGVTMDAGITPRMVATGMGISVLIPAALWSMALRFWRMPEKEGPASVESVAATDWQPPVG